MQWLRLPPLAPAPQPAPALDAPRPLARPLARPIAAAPRTPASAPVARPGPAAAPAASSSSDAAPPTAQEPTAASGAPAEPPSRPSAAAIMENARRSIPGIERALRKESKPLIVAPPDSPELRMRQGMEQAHALAPPRIFEAPKVEELVNNTGDGARRTRVITGRRTYCVTERSPATNVEMIEMHGKIRLTNCPTPEEPAKRQEWRTARD